MSWLLFLDDERDPVLSIDHDGYRRGVGLPPLRGIILPRPWMIARSVVEAEHHIRQRGAPGFIAFDHDLGEGKPTGYDFAKELVDRDLDGSLGLPRGFSYEVHSANPVGAANIRGLLDGYLAFRKREMGAARGPGH